MGFNEVKPKVDVLNHLRPCSRCRHQKDERFGKWRAVHHPDVGGGDPTSFMINKWTCNECLEKEEKWISTLSSEKPGPKPKVP